MGLHLVYILVITVHSEYNGILYLASILGMYLVSVGIAELSEYTGIVERSD